MSKSIAVIGSGIAGLAAAHGCRTAGHRVSLFEAQPRIGMDAHALQIDGGVVDVPLRIMNPNAWQSVLALTERVGVKTFATPVDLSCSWSDGRTWFRNARMPVTGWPVPSSWRYLNRRALRLGQGVAWLTWLTKRLQSTPSAVTLAEALQSETVDPLFWRGLVLPILQTICTCDEEHLLAWPAAELLILLQDVMTSVESMRLQGGTAALAEALVAGVSHHVGSRVTRVCQDEAGVDVRNERGEGGRFDAVIVATQANQLDFLDSAQFAGERRVLQGIPYARGELVVHRDQRFLPRWRRDWAAVNFQMDAAMRNSTFTVWVNAVEPSLAGKPPVFQTWNPRLEPRKEQLLMRQPMQRAVVNGNTHNILAQLRSWHLQSERRLFYCGSWAYEGVPLLESAVRSAEAVVKLIRK